MGQPDPKAQAAEMHAGIAAALAESQFKTNDEAVEASWDSWENEGGAAPAAATQEETEEAQLPSGEQEAASEAEVQELPDSFWGVDLSGIPVEQKQAIAEHLQQQEGYIQQLQARLAKEPEPLETPEPEELKEVTDEELALALGYDPDDLYNKPSPQELQLARTVLDLEDKVMALSSQTTAEKAAADWNSQLDKLEATYGKLPLTRAETIRYIVEEGITTPFEAYARISLPGRKQVEEAVAKTRQAAAKQAVQGQVKPRSSASTDSTPIKGESMRDAVARAMREAEQETGARWKTLFGKKVVQND